MLRLLENDCCFLKKWLAVVLPHLPVGKKFMRFFALYDMLNALKLTKLD